MTEHERNQVFMLAQTGHNLDEISEISSVGRTECSLLVGGAGTYCMTCLDGASEFEKAEAAVLALELENERTIQEASAADSTKNRQQSKAAGPRPVR